MNKRIQHASFSSSNYCTPTLHFSCMVFLFLLKLITMQAFLPPSITLPIHQESYSLFLQNIKLQCNLDNDNLQSIPYKLSFSECYQRYILINSQTNQIEQSFRFLDDAFTHSPNATLPNTNFHTDNPPNQTNLQDQLLYLSKFTANPIKGGQSQAQIYHYLNSRITPERLLPHHTKSHLSQNYNRVMDLLTRSRNPSNSNNLLFRNPGLAMDQHEARNVISTLPQILLYDYSEMEERIQFLLNPKPLMHAGPGVDCKHPILTKFCRSFLFLTCCFDIYESSRAEIFFLGIWCRIVHIPSNHCDSTYPSIIILSLYGFPQIFVRTFSS